MKDMTKKECAEMWRQVVAYVEQLERAIETQRAQLKRRQERINALKARARAERTCRIEHHYGEWYCNGCGHMVGTCDTASELFIDGNAIELWKHCPNCGAKVIGGDAE